MTGPPPRADSVNRPTVAVDATATVGGFTVSASFTADAGVTALFGPSGAGKSITLAMIAGLVRPTTGTISIAGRSVADPQADIHVRTQERRLGMSFQQAALLPHRSPLDNVALAVRDGTRRERRGRALELLEQVRAGHLATASTTGLSGGERQRIALARALAGDPRVLLLDEPFSALDRPTRQALQTLVADLVAQHELTALLVTHDLDDLARLADRVVVYEIGRTLGTRSLDGVHADALPHLVGLLDPLPEDRHR